MYRGSFSFYFMDLPRGRILLSLTFPSPFLRLWTRCKFFWAHFLNQAPGPTQKKSKSSCPGQAASWWQGKENCFICSLWRDIGVISQQFGNWYDSGPHIGPIDLQTKTLARIYISLLSPASSSNYLQGTQHSECHPGQQSIRQMAKLPHRSHFLLSHAFRPSCHITSHPKL